MAEISKFMSKDIGDLSKIFGADKENLSSILGLDATPAPPPESTEFTVHNMSGASTPSPFVVTESSVYYGNRFGWLCWNGGWSNVQMWMANGVKTGWVKLDIGSSNTKVMTSYKIKCVMSWLIPARSPSEWTMQGSNNNSDWDIIDTVTGSTGWAAEELREYTCDVATTAYRYFMIDITDNDGDASYVQIGESYYYGY